jgi:peptide/nickel transport system permease protein
MAFFPWKRFLRSKTAWFSLLVMLVFGLVAVLAPWLAPHDPTKWSFSQTNLPPMWVNDAAGAGVAEFPLGTDRVGRDILSRMIYGTRTSFILAFTAVPLAALIGTLLGLIAGFRGGRLDTLIVLLTDIFQSLPGIMFMVVLILIFRSILAPTWLAGLVTLVIGYAAVSWVSLARLVRINVLMIKSRLFVEAAAALGASRRYIITHHLLPNVLHVILAWIINNIPAIIILEAVLGYIGVGVTGATEGGEFNVVSWGGLFFAGRSAFSRNPVILILPSLSLMLVCVSFILFSDLINEITHQEQQ